jgi:hypothetical protein
VSAAASRRTLVLTRSGVQGAVDAAALRDEFRRAHCVRLPGLIDRSLLDDISARMASGVFRTKAHGDAALELCLEPDETVGLLHFLVNEPAMFRLIETVSETAPIKSFFGRVYRHVPGGGHFQDWHGDVEPDRHIGLSINLGAQPYGGGVFQIRHRDSERLSAAVHNTGFGDAIVFRLRDDLEHRVTALEGAVAKTAFAGWFRSAPDYLAVLRGEAPVDP